MQNFVYALIMVKTSYRQAIQRKIRDLGIDITFEMLQVMRCLYKKDMINQQVLASQIHKDKSSMSYLLNNMEKRKLISRTEDQTDKRNKLISLTNYGNSVHNQIKSAIDTIYEKVEKEITPQKLDICIENMNEISRILNK